MTHCNCSPHNNPIVLSRDLVSDRMGIRREERTTPGSASTNLLSLPQSPLQSCGPHQAGRLLGGGKSALVGTGRVLSDSSRLGEHVARVEYSTSSLLSPTFSTERNVCSHIHFISCWCSMSALPSNKIYEATTISGKVQNRDKDSGMCKPSPQID